MKKVFYILISVLAVVACSSKEDKANKLIKDYMFKHLHDFKSYEAVETKVDTLYNTPLSDNECISLANTAYSTLENVQEYGEKAERDEQTMDIWSGGWSSTSRKEYTKAYKSWINNKINETTERITYLTAAKELLEKTKNLDGKKQVGWLVTHTFRSNTLGGNSSLGNYIFLMDKDFKSILANYDAEDEDIANALSTISAIETNLESPEQVDSSITGWFSLIDRYNEMLEKVK